MRKNAYEHVAARTIAAGSGPIFHHDGAIGRIVDGDEVRQRETNMSFNQEGKREERERRREGERERKRNMATTGRGIESGQNPERKKDSVGKRGRRGREGRLRPGAPAEGRG